VLKAGSSTARQAPGLAPLAWREGFGYPVLRTLAVLGLCACPLWAQERKENPEPPSDRCFVVDTPQPGFRQDVDEYRRGTLVIQIPVTRYCGPVDANGYLTHASGLIDRGYAKPYANLRMLVYDVDFNCGGDNCCGDPECRCERNEVRFNGVPVHSLHPDNDRWVKGANEVWRVSDYKIPLSAIKFPHAPGEGDDGRPHRAVNTVEVVIDRLGAGCWASTVDWVSLKIGIMSPIVLVPGINTDRECFLRQHFEDEPNSLGLPYDRSIDFGPGIQGYDDRIAKNADFLNAHLTEKIVKAYGVDSLHLVCHSKGGLDARAYLAQYEPPAEWFRYLDGERHWTLSLTTIATLHEGSVLADVLVQARDATQAVAHIEYRGFPFYLFFNRFVDHFVKDFRPGNHDLTTAAASAFNIENIENLAAARSYFAVWADADQNGNRQIDAGAEFAGFAEEDPDCRPKHASLLYQILGTVSSVETTERWVQNNHWSARVVTISAVPQTGLFTPNDCAVSIYSAGHPGAFSHLLRSWSYRWGGAGRNHFSIIDRATAATVIYYYLAPTEREIGDLR